MTDFENIPQAHRSYITIVCAYCLRTVRVELTGLIISELTQNIFGCPVCRRLNNVSVVAAKSFQRKPRKQAHGEKTRKAGK